MANKYRRTMKIREKYCLDNDVGSDDDGFKNGNWAIITFKRLDKFNSI